MFCDPNSFTAAYTCTTLPTQIAIANDGFVTVSLSPSHPGS